MNRYKFARLMYKVGAIISVLFFCLIFMGVNKIIALLFLIPIIFYSYLGWAKLKDTSPLLNFVPVLKPKNKALAYEYKNVDVCIIRGQEPNFRKIKPFRSVRLVPEPTNIHDPYAVAVIVGITRIGYIYRGRLQDMINDYLNSGDIVTAYIEHVSQPNRRISIHMKFYKLERIIVPIRTEYVFVAKNSKIYHCVSDCRQMKTPTKMTTIEAEAKNLRPCSICAFESIPKP